MRILRDKSKAQKNKREVASKYPQKPISISKNLTISIVLTIIVVATISIAAIYLDASKRQKRELNLKADEYLSYFIGTLVLPLWNVDIRTIKVIGETVSQNELIVKLCISNHLGHCLYHIERAQGTDLINRSGRIFHKAKILGKVEFSLTKKIHQAENRRLLLIYCISFAIVIFVLIFVTGLLVRRFLKRPLKGLNYIVESYAIGEYHIVPSRLSHIEFMPFENVLSKMGDKIQSQMNELKQTMAALRKARDEMEAKVIDRTAELLEAKDRAEAANMAKSTFISTMSHELRTPLNAIFGFSQLISRSTCIPAEHKEQLELINRNSEHLLSLINHVLDMSKIEAGRATLEEHSFDLKELLDEIEQGFRLRSIDKGLSFRSEVTAKVPRYITADEVKIRQVLINLLDNAVKYTVKGMVSLKVETQAGDDGQVTGGKKLCFTVEDSGPGIAADELDHIFEAFIQTRAGIKQQEGTGLGLALSKQFTELMGGTLSVHSLVDKGSVFCFQIPLKVATVNQVGTKGIHPQVVGLEPGQGRYRILVVDDLGSSRRLMTDILTHINDRGHSDSGFNVMQASNGQEALEHWQRWEPHLIWMDMHLPVMDGYETARKIKATIQGRATVIIGLSASALEEQRSAVLSAGCDDFMRKPFKLHDFFNMLHQHLGVRYIYAEPSSINGNPKTLSVQFHLISESLSKVPITMRTELLRAAKETHPKKTQAVLDRIAKLHPSLAGELTKLTANFRFDLLRDLLEGTE